MQICRSTRSNPLRAQRFHSKDTGPLFKPFVTTRCCLPLHWSRKFSEWFNVKKPGPHNMAQWQEKRVTVDPALVQILAQAEIPPQVGSILCVSNCAWHSHRRWTYTKPSPATNPVYFGRVATDHFLGRPGKGRMARKGSSGPPSWDSLSCLCIGIEIDTVRKTTLYRFRWRYDTYRPITSDPWSTCPYAC